MTELATNDAKRNPPMSEETRSKATEELSLDDLARLIESTTGFDLNESKVIAYWSIATHGLTDIRVMPVLVLNGPISTGKTTTMRTLKLLVRQPRSYDGKGSLATWRDALKYETTLLVEDADEIKSEGYLTNRFSRSEGVIEVKRPTTGAGYRDDSPNLFGALVLHRRRSFSNPSSTSRSIILFSKKKFQGVLPFDEDAIEEYRPIIEATASRIDWHQVKEVGERARHKWMPLILVARELADEDFEGYAEDQIKLEEETLQAGQDEEPRLVVFRAVLAEATSGGDLIMPLDRVDLSAVKRRVREDNDWFNDFQVGQTLTSDLGMEKKKVGGEMRVITGGRAGLKRVADAIGYEDEWFETTQEKEEPNT